MKKVSEYRDHAEECRKMAAGTSNEEHRAALFKMAETWDSLAEERTERLRQQQRIAALEHSPTDEE
jgi:hypothetical protein